MRQLRELILSDLRSKWSGSALTWSWALLHPLIQISLYAIVFSSIMVPRSVTFSNSGTYLIYLCSGIFCWLGFSEALTRGTISLLDGARLIRGRGLALALLPLRTTATAWILTLVGFVVTLCIAPLAGVFPSWTWLLLPIPLLSLFILSLGFSLLLAPLTVLIRDISQLTHLILPLIFWATPIVYDQSILPSWAQNTQFLNPIQPAITTIHTLLIRYECPTTSTWFSLIFLPILSIVCGWYVLRNLESEVRDAL